jgi:hypothetical protein
MTWKIMIRQFSVFVERLDRPQSQRLVIRSRSLLIVLEMTFTEQHVALKYHFSVFYLGSPESLDADCWFIHSPAIDAKNGHMPLK